MAYAQRMPSKNRTLVLMTVAGLHGVALYGLVTGLGVDYVEQVIPGITGRNIPIDPPPPEPQPTAKPQVNEPRADITPRTAPKPREPLTPPVMDVVEKVIDFPIQPDPRGTLDRFDPAPRPTQTPSFAPRGARARNDPAGWVSTSDYPTGSLHRNEQGTVRFELGVGPDGRVQSCRVTGSSGSTELDAATCRQVTRRARLEPATGSAGEPVTGTYAGSIRWVIPQD